MVKNSLQIVAVVCALTIFVDQSSAQRSGGGGCNRGGSMGEVGSALAGGSQRTGANAGFLTNAAMMGQLAGMSRQRPQNAIGGNQVDSNRSPRPTPEQFARAAGRFDRDRDGLLNREELSQVAAAVIAELHQRPERAGRTVSARSGSQRSAGSGKAAPSVAQMTETFVSRSLSFDADDDGALNASETRMMAAALIRSLG
ncbi:MAG: hypothetical protein GY903_23605 [Fuerstiella sp.]|nr:hypothetical protein [Fuerstiella sp.]MCP4857481.1 hypothetical protein [Fuerstiella sp.]